MNQNNDKVGKIYKQNNPMEKEEDLMEGLLAEHNKLNVGNRDFFKLQNHYQIKRT